MEEDEEASPSTKTLLVRGRFNFRSGSDGRSTGEAVADVAADLDFLLRVLGTPSISFALSKSPQARDSSLVSSGVGGVRGRRGRRGCGAVWKVSRAPCRLAMFNLCCHRWNSLACPEVRR